jgi:putative transposase
VDTAGLLLRVLVFDIQDWDGAEDLFLLAKPSRPRRQRVWADSAYGRNELPEWTLEADGWQVEVVSKPPEQRGCVPLPRRWVGERTLAGIGRNRRRSKDSAELAETTEAWVYAAMPRLMLRRLVSEAA